MKSFIRMWKQGLKTHTFSTHAVAGSLQFSPHPYNNNADIGAVVVGHHHGASGLPSHFLFVQRCMSTTTFVKKKSHYEVLGLTRSATTQEIRTAFLKLSKQCHPDLNTSDPTMHQKFVKINEAYSVLSRPLSRRDYDSTLDADRYVQRHMNNSASAYRSHGYGYSAEAGAQYHYKGHMYDETEWSHHYQKEGDNLRKLANFYILTFCVTLGAVALILQYMYIFVPDPKLGGLKRMTNAEIEQHELIMTSEHEGSKVFYYAIPKENDPKNVNVVAVTKRQVGENSDEHEIRELTTISMDPTGSSKAKYNVK